MKKQVRFLYGIGDKVFIRVNQRAGIVVAMSVTINGGQLYEVEYADNNGVVHSHKFRAQEIREAPKE